MDAQKAGQGRGRGVGQPAQKPERVQVWVVQALKRAGKLFFNIQRGAGCGYQAGFRRQGVAKSGGLRGAQPGKDDGKVVQRQNRLGPNRQFSYVYRRGKRVSTRDLTLLYVKNRQKRVGFSVSKKVGVAVVRNRTKRRLRECVRPLLERMNGGLYVFVARPSAAEQSFAQLNRQVGQLLTRAGTLAAPDHNTP